jgi:hypothetical protein
MTPYEAIQERDGPFEAWAVVAIGVDGHERFVSRQMSQEQARAMTDRLHAMATAEKVLSAL